MGPAHPRPDRPRRAARQPRVRPPRRPRRHPPRRRCYLGACADANTFELRSWADVDALTNRVAGLAPGESPPALPPLRGTAFPSLAVDADLEIFRVASGNSVYQVLSLGFWIGQSLAAVAVDIGANVGIGHVTLPDEGPAVYLVTAANGRLASGQEPGEYAFAAIEHPYEKGVGLWLNVVGASIDLLAILLGRHEVLGECAGSIAGDQLTRVPTTASQLLALGPDADNAGQELDAQTDQHIDAASAAVVGDAAQTLADQVAEEIAAGAEQ